MNSGALTYSSDYHHIQHFDLKVDDYAVIEWPDHQMLRLDLEGRWCTLQTGSALYRRTVDGEVVIQKGESYEGIGLNEQAKLLQHIKNKLKHFIDQCTHAHSELTIDKWDELNEVIQRALKWDWDDYEKDAETFRNIYPEAIPILPPDRYRDIVVQPATGCPYGKCSFCMFYKDQRFHILDPEKFRQQLSSIKTFFGQSIRSRKGVFLGSASAISIPQTTLLPFLELISNEFSYLKKGISSFMDPHHMPNRSVDDYKTLKEAGLHQVVIGLETGSNSLRQQLGKSGKLDELSEVVAILKQAGLQVGLTVLIGAGGPQWALEHLQDTADFIQQLPLEASDIIYLSPLVEGNQPLVPEKEVARFKKHLTSYSRARLVPYRIQKFRYFS